ncbi:condensin complex subunit 3-like isoform X2 [Zophobas morio]|uniref:condensin complex subunit 3-like isoform X2 n=1 Tax=Zophobas morio TaxID=2755281 RepID=UPI00308292B6
MATKEFEKVFTKVQTTSACHQKCVIVLTDIYKKTPREEFMQLFLKFLQLVVRQNIDNGQYTKRVLNFVSMFCADLTKKEQKENQTHEFLTPIIEKTIEWSVTNVYDIRYNSCYFIAMVLQDIGEEVQLEVNLIDEIQRVMLERMQENKIPIRLAAMSALVRLQDPHNFECPVIQAYLRALLSGSAQIRKEATERIAPNVMTLSKIRDRVRDTDVGVRAMAFHRCADIGPLNFRIVDKHLILLCGFKETNEKVKKTFSEYLLPKWLTGYKGDFLKFLEALKLIADEEDISKMTYLSRELIRVFYNQNPIDDLIKALPINEEKLINVEHLTNNVTLFWNILTNLLRESDEMDRYLNEILPEMTPFCHYLDRVITAKSAEQMDEWKFFEYQFDLLNLFEIAEKYDFSDEVGRRTMHSLTLKILQNNNFTLKLTKKLVAIAHKCSSNLEFFTHDMCQVISELQEPVVDEPLSLDKQRERDFKTAELRVKLNILKERQNEAINERNYQKAQELEQKLADVSNQLEKLQTQLDVEKVRVQKTDNETLCRCLDVLSSVLELPAVSKLTPSLITCRDQFLVPLIMNQGAEPHWRVLKCLALFSVIDKATAVDYAKIICIPIVTYRTVQINASVLTQSICSVTDLISLYGVEIIGQEEETINTTVDQTARRKLYTNDNEESMNTTNAKIDKITMSYIFEIYLDMLDDERDEIRHKAILAIAALVKQSFPVTASLLSRILLKWYSPLTEKHDSRLQIYLGYFIEQYTRFKTCGEVMKEAIVPTLTSLLRAPRTSPLADVDIDNVLNFFSEMMNIHLQNDDLRILALDLCMKILENVTDRIVPFLAKLLYNLELERTNVACKTELIERGEMLLENLSDKQPRKNIEKLVSKLKQSCVIQTNTTVNTTEQMSESQILEETNNTGNEQTCNVLQEVSINEQDIIKGPQQVKRRKSRSNKNCVVVLEKLNLSRINQNRCNETTLHTIIETSMEMDIDNHLTIETPTTNSSNSSKISSRMSKIVITETSDSDTESEVPQRRSSRCRKKRIVPSV